ncbi:hypothetical protein [Moorena producens]|uniref:hypothetical protein n=1 Tax=Moorena producens TaxID=1155739 RepID=UPI003C739C94
MRCKNRIDGNRERKHSAVSGQRSALCHRLRPWDFRDCETNAYRLSAMQSASGGNPQDRAASPRPGCIAYSKAVRCSLPYVHKHIN